MRVLLESLDDLHRERNNIVKRAQRLADADDISDCVLKEASKSDKTANVQPLMFEEASDEELAKYDKFLVEMREFEEKQNSILADVKVRRVIVLGNEALTRFGRNRTSYSCNLEEMTPLSRTESLDCSHSSLLISSTRRLVGTSKKGTRLLSRSVKI